MTTPALRALRRLYEYTGEASHDCAHDDFTDCPVAYARAVLAQAAPPPVHHHDYGAAIIPCSQDHGAAPPPDVGYEAGVPVGGWAAPPSGLDYSKLWPNVACDALAYNGAHFHRFEDGTYSGEFTGPHAALSPDPVEGER